MTLERIEHRACFGGWQDVYRHDSAVLGCAMNFAVYLPPQAETQKLPVLYWLSGLTCTEQNFITKAGAQRYAAEHGVILVAPDTSPRGDDVADADGYDLGKGAGFYLNATQAPWSEHYRMYDYVASELPALVEANFPATDARAISGHSMGGHGALVVALKNPGPLPQRVGVLADRRAVAGAVGREGVHRLPGRRPGSVEGVGCDCAGRRCAGALAAAGRPGRCRRIPGQRN